MTTVYLMMYIEWNTDMSNDETTVKSLLTVRLIADDQTYKMSLRIDSQ
jgi:hypothetical protein